MTLNLLKPVNQSKLVDLLDWNSIISPIQSYVRFDTGKERLASSPNVSSGARVQEDYQRLKIFRDLDIEDLDQINDIYKVFNSYDYQDCFTSFNKNRDLKLDQLNVLAQFIQCQVSLIKTLKPHISSLQLDQVDREVIKAVDKLREFISYDGKEIYNLHPELRQLFGDLFNLESNLREKCKNLLRSSQYKDIIALDQYDIFENRFVIAINSDAYQSNFGMILSHSNSGKTLFIEPLSLRELNNKKLLVEAQIDKYIYQKCREIQSVFYKHKVSLNSICERVIDLDYYSGLATFYCDNPFYSIPEVSFDDSFEVKGLFHPAIEKCISNNLDLAGSKKGIVISGPNTGGKTVLLKQIGLVFLLYHKGLLVPCKYAKIPHIDYFYFHCNDHQSLMEGLSSFSSEVKIYLDIIAELKSGSIKNPLLIIDEIFNSTTSEDASALACSILDELKLYSKNLIFISTHHESLKINLHQDKDYISAHMGFNLEESLATYKLFIGEPGSSMGLSIFKKIITRDYENRLYSNAKKYLDRKTQNYEILLSELHSKKIHLDKEYSNITKLKKDLENQKEAHLSAMKLEKKSIIDKFKNKINDLVFSNQKLLAEIKSKQEHRELSNKLQEIKENKKNLLEERTNDEVNQADININPVSFSNIGIGDTVYCIPLKTNVRITDLNKRKREIQITKNNISSWQKLDALALIDTYNKADKPVQHRYRQQATDAPIEIDLRGYRLEEFILEVEKNLSNLVSEDIPFLNIIHGQGEGILKSWLRNYIQEHKDIYRFEIEDGNDGVTRILLN